MARYFEDLSRSVGMSVSSGQMKRRSVIFRVPAHFLVFQEEFDSLLIAVRRCVMQWGPEFGIADIRFHS